MRLLAFLFFGLLASALSFSSVSCVPLAACPETYVSFKACVQPLLLANCTGGGCHGGDKPEFGLQLEKDIYKNIVGKDSGQGFPMKFIEAGAPDKSYLYLKLIQDKPTSGKRMPLDRGTLFEAHTKAIQQWIKEGALDN